MKVTKVIITLGFGETVLTDHYKKGEGKTFKDALQDMIAKRFNYFKDEEKLAMIEFIETVQNMNLSFLSPAKPKKGVL